MNQSSLFTWGAQEASDIKAGDIVPVDFAPFYGMHIPLWQVRFIQTHDDGRTQAYCHAVPYGAHPENITWYDLGRIHATGVRWDVPSWDDLNTWNKDRYQKSVYVRSLNMWPGPGHQPHCEGCGAVLILTWRYGPYAEEQELADQLDSVGGWLPIHQCDPDQPAVVAVLQQDLEEDVHAQ